MRAFIRRCYRSSLVKLTRGRHAGQRVKGIWCARVAFENHAIPGAETWRTVGNWRRGRALEILSRPCHLCEHEQHVAACRAGLVPFDSKRFLLSFEIELRHGNRRLSRQTAASLGQTAQGRRSVERRTIDGDVRARRAQCHAAAHRRSHEQRAPLHPIRIPAPTAEHDFDEARGRSCALGSPL